MLTTVTVDIPQELAGKIRPLTSKLPQILELGWREWTACQEIGFDSAFEVFELLANLPSPEEVLDLRPSEEFAARIGELLEKQRTTSLTEAEEDEWERYEYLEHLVRKAKARAYLKLRAS